MCVGFVLAMFSLAQENQFISYSVNGKKFHLTDVKLQSSGENGYFHLEGIKKERVDFGADHYPRYRDMEVGITVEVSPENSIAGTHTAHSSDIMPVYVNWYETVKSQNKTEIKEILASMDSGSEDMLEFTVTFENTGPIGTIIKGTFTGKLLDEEGNPYTISDGKFVIKLTEIE